MTSFDWTITVLVGFLNLKGLLDRNCLLFFIYFSYKHVEQWHSIYAVAMCLTSRFRKPVRSTGAYNTSTLHWKILHLWIWVCSNSKHIIYSFFCVIDQTNFCALFCHTSYTVVTSVSLFRRWCWLEHRFYRFNLNDSEPEIYHLNSFENSGLCALRKNCNFEYFLLTA